MSGLGGWTAALAAAARKRELMTQVVGATWRDVVFQRIGREEIDPLRAADRAYQSQCEALASQLDRASSELDSL